MKKALAVLLSAAVLSALTGCELSNKSATNEVMNSLMDSSSKAQTEAKEDKVTEKNKISNLVSEKEPTGDVLDLRELSPTVVYSEVFAMMNEPQDYEGKTIIAKGPFSYYKDENSGQEYYAVIVKDATACCAQGIEFELAGDNKYPDDYPNLNDEITVEGLFNCYTDDTGTYVQLIDAKML